MEPGAALISTKVLHLFCMCTHVFVCAWVYVHVSRPELSLGVFLLCAPPFVLRQSLTEPGPRTPLPSAPCPGTAIVGIHAVPVSSELMSPCFSNGSLTELPPSVLLINILFSFRMHHAIFSSGISSHIKHLSSESYGPIASAILGRASEMAVVL